MKKLLFGVAILAFASTMHSCQTSDAAPVKMVADIPDYKYETPVAIVVPKDVKITPVRKYPTRILQHLDKLILTLERGAPMYDWTNNTSCNVGILAQCVTNLPAKGIEDGLMAYRTKDFKNFCKYASVDENAGLWTNYVNYYCGVTNRPIWGIIGKLQKAGFTSTDIANIEYCSDPYILLKVGKELKYSNGHDYLTYMKAWRDIIANQ